MTETEFLGLFDRYHSMVYALALSYTKSPQDAEDVCQTVFLRLLERPPAQGKEKAWLAKVTVNQCKSLLRAPWRRRRVEPEEGWMERLGFEAPEDGALWEAVMALPLNQRVLIHLRFYEGFTVAELAEQYKLPAAVVSARLYRAKQQLKRKMEGLEDGTEVF